MLEWEISDAKAGATTSAPSPLRPADTAFQVGVDWCHVAVSSRAQSQREAFLARPRSTHRILEWERTI
jgi:hypothetical protein